MASLPSIARLEYLDVILRLFRDSTDVTLEEARLSLGKAVEELAARGAARMTRDWRHSLAYRDTTVDCVRELMRWNYLEHTPLADTAVGFERIRKTALKITEEGRRVASLRAPDRREAFGQWLLRSYALFRQFLELTQTHDILVPELTDTNVRKAMSVLANAANDQDGWKRLALGATETIAQERNLGAGRRLRIDSRPDTEKVTEQIGMSLRKRFAKRPPKDLKELTGAVNKAIAAAYLRTIGFAGEWNSYDRCLRWGRDLFLTNDARHVHDIAGWVAWSTATIQQTAEGWRFERRGLTLHREEVKASLVEAYGRIASGRRGSGSQVPMVPIYQVRETVAFECRVADDVVDRVLGELATRKEAVPHYSVQLHIADSRDFVPSARPFWLNDKRYFYITLFPSADTVPTSGGDTK